MVTTATMTGEVILPEDFDPLQMLENFETFAKFALTETKMLPPPKQVRHTFFQLYATSYSAGDIISVKCCRF